MNKEIKLPELPDPTTFNGFHLSGTNLKELTPAPMFTGGQMQAYARAAIEQDRAQRGRECNDDRQSRDEGVRALIEKWRSKYDLNEDSAGRDCADELEAALTPTNGPASDGWLPIESAPKDGSLVLLATPHGVVASAWDTWADGEQYFGNDYVEYDNATHWMPLPDPPGVTA